MKEKKQNNTKKTKQNGLWRCCRDGVVIMGMEGVVAMAYVTGGGVVGIVVIMSYFISKKRKLVIKKKTEKNTPLLK